MSTTAPTTEVSAPNAHTTKASIALQQTAPEQCSILLSGTWSIEYAPPSLDAILQQIKQLPSSTTVVLSTTSIASWGSPLVTAVITLINACRAQGITIHTEQLPAGVQSLTKLAFAVPERSGAARAERQTSFFERVGEAVSDIPRRTRDILSFIGEVSVAIIRMLYGKADFRWQDVWLMIQECGSKALPIVSLISLLVGLILAFVGAVQLKAFGAQIYVADLVGIAMVRVMGAVMAGITMAGRTGAAFAAILGTMQVNEEVDALSTLGVSPTEFLILPRVVALTLMMPLLTIYADVMGILGGLIVGVGMLDLNIMEYLNATERSLSIKNMWVGVIHGTLFGLAIALCGCYNGIRCGRSALAVGKSTTTAVVSSIISIIIITAIVTVICEVLGI